MCWNVEKESDIAHYGVLGMKWGVRRYQPYPKGKHGTFLGQSRDEDVVIKKGTKAYRLQKGEALAPGQSYVSFDTFDHYKYVAHTAAGEMGLGIDLSDGKGKSLRMVLDRDIIAPSYEATMDAFIHTISEMEGPKKFAKDALTSGRSKEQDKAQQKRFINNLMDTTLSDGLDNAYLMFSATLMKDTKAKEIFFNDLKKKGYNAIIDDNDKRFGSGFTESPVILFDSSNIKVNKSVSITDKDIEYFNDLVWGAGRDPKMAGYEKEKKTWETFAGHEKERKQMYGDY